MIITAFVILMIAIVLIIITIKATQYDSCKTSANRITKIDKRMTEK